MSGKKTNINIDVQDLASFKNLPSLGFIAPMHNMRLGKSFYLRSDVLGVAQELLGKYLVTNFQNQVTVVRIVETEAYRASDDKACHAYNNRRTKRTEVMFEEGGIAYVYLCYGIHHLFNVVTAPKDIAQAVLIRAVEPIENVSLMLERRKMKKVKRQLTAGPGVLSKALGIHTKHSGVSLIEQDSPIWLEDRGEVVQSEDIISSPRVGVDFAEECAAWNWRFRLKNSQWTSLAK